MLPFRVLCVLAFALVAVRSRANAQETKSAAPAESDEPDVAPTVEDAAPSYPIFDPELRLIGGLERRLEHPRASQVGEHSRQPFYLQQARIEIDVEVDKWLSGSFSGELSDNPVVRDAFVNARIKRWFQIQAGHFKRPMSRIELTGSTRLPFRGRGLFNRALLRRGEWGNRALGVMLWGKVRKAALSWNLAVMNAAETVDARRPEQLRGVDVLGRVEYAPARWLEIAVNGGYKNTEPYLNGPSVDLLAVGGDVRIRAGGFRLVVDVIGAQNARPPVPPDSRGRTPYALGVNGYATYEIGLGLRAALQPVIVGEWADTDLELSRDETVRAVAGLNLLLFDGAYRVMPQVELVRPLGEVGARSQVKRETYTLMLSAVL